MRPVVNRYDMRRKAMYEKILRDGDLKVKIKAGNLGNHRRRSCCKCHRKFISRGMGSTRENIYRNKLHCPDCYKEKMGFILRHARYLTQEEEEQRKREMKANGITITKLSPEELFKILNHSTKC